MNEEHPILKRYPDLKEFVRIIRDEVLRNQRPACETILFDEDMMKILGICSIYPAVRYITSHWVLLITGTDTSCNTEGRGPSEMDV